MAELERETLELLVALLAGALVAVLVVGVVLRRMYVARIAFWKRSRDRLNAVLQASVPAGEQRPPTWQDLVRGVGWLPEEEGR